MSKGKNCIISNASMLIVRFLTYSDQIKWLRAMPTLVVDLCLSLPNWHEWMKLLDIDRNCNLSPIIFSKSLPVMLSNMIEWNNLDKSYKALLGLGIMTVVNILKWDGQWPKSAHTLAILISLIMYSLFLMIFLICSQDNLSGPGVKELLHFSMALMSSSFEKETYFIISLSGISSNRLILTWWFWVELKDLWSASYKSFSLIQDWLLYWMASVARSFFFLTQFMSSQRLQFLLVILSIFPLKKFHFVFLTVSLNFFPVFQSFGLSVHIKIPMTIIIPPSLRMLSNINVLGVFVPYSVNIVGK